MNEIRMEKKEDFLQERCDKVEVMEIFKETSLINSIK